MSSPKSYVSAICQWPKDDRPRERLFEYGEHRLSNTELLAILLRSGIRGKSAVDLARQIIGKFKTFRNMSHTELGQWQEFKGLGPAKLAQIKAAIEIGRRLGQEAHQDSRKKIKSAQDAVDILMPRMRDLKVEVFKTIHLNSQNHIIKIVEESEGTVNYTTPIIREILKKAILEFASSIICVHNHPSGSPQPSVEDRDFTRRLKDAGIILQIKVLDHIIIGDDCYFSFAEAGRMPS